jgi:hypothetical protein
MDMASPTKQYEIFLSFEPEALSKASAIESRFIAAGLRVFNPQVMLRAGKKYESSLREALIGSLVVVALPGDPPRLSPQIAVEIGAAMALEKPVFALVEDAEAVASGTLPRGIEILSLNDAAQLAARIRQMGSTTRLTSGKWRRQTAPSVAG